MHKIGFIGCGNMGRAIIKGIVSSGVCEPGDIIASAHTQATLDAAHEQFGIDVTLDNTQAAQAEIVVLAVKPYMFDEVVPQIAPSLPKDVVLISIAPAKTLAWLSETAGVAKVVRLMPNTPAAVGEGMTSVVPNDACTQEDIDRVLSIVNSFGKSEFIPEKLIDAGSAVAGCAPAFFYMFIEAMADAAVLEGMPRAQAYRFAAQAAIGSGKMVLESGQHPGALKDAVCSPGGTTIEGVRTLEEMGMRGSVINALMATVDKAQSL